MRPKYLIFTIILLVIVGLGLIILKARTEQQSSSQSQPRRVESVESSEIGQKIVDFELEDFAGNKVKLSSFAGKLIFIDFWAAWCPFCVEEMVEIEKIHKKFGDQLVVLGIHRSETESTDLGAKFAQERGVTYTLLKDSEGSVYKTLTGGRQFMPYALFIDKEDKIISVKAGPKTADEIRQKVEVLLQ